MADQDVDTAPDALAREAVELVADAAPITWQRLILRYRATVSLYQCEVTAHLADGTTAAVDIPYEVHGTIAELRSLTAVPGQGAWFSAEISADRAGQVSTSFNYTEDPDWPEGIPATIFSRDLDFYPRTDDAIPDWLREKLREAKSIIAELRGGPAEET